MIVALAKQKLPEVVTLILHPRGRITIDGVHQIESPRRWSRLTVNWRVVRLWELPAEELLKSGDVGLIPWAPLTQYDQPVEEILEQCRVQIDAAAENEQENLLAVTQVLGSLRIDADVLFDAASKCATLEEFGAAIDQLPPEADPFEDLEFIK